MANKVATNAGPFERQAGSGGNEIFVLPLSNSLPCSIPTVGHDDAHPEEVPYGSKTAHGDISL